MSALSESNPCCCNPTQGIRAGYGTSQTLIYRRNRKFPGRFVVCLVSVITKTLTYRRTSIRNLASKSIFQTLVYYSIATCTRLVCYDDDMAGCRDLCELSASACWCLLSRKGSLHSRQRGVTWALSYWMTQDASVSFSEAVG